MTRKKKIEQNRTRYRTVAFRMSEYEWAELNERVYLSGRQKQDFLIKSTLYQEVIVIGNKLVFNRLSEKLDQIAEQLIRIKEASEASDLEPEILAPLRTAVDIMSGFQKEDTGSSVGTPQKPTSAFEISSEMHDEKPTADVKMMSITPKTGGNTCKSSNTRTRKCW